MTRISWLIRIFVICIVVCMTGCRQDASTPVEIAVTSPLMYQPKGTITGLINNKATQAPIAGAVFSLGFDGGVQSVTSDSTGAFSFANLPVGQYKIVNGNAVFTGQYTLIVSLVNYNTSQSDPEKKYRDYYYDTVTITFTSLAPGDSLAVSDMVGSVRLQITYLNTTVTGQVVDQKMQPVADAVVTLFDATITPNVAITQTSTSTDGIFRFTHVDNGLTINIKAASSDGSLEGALPHIMTLPLNIITDSLRSQVTTEQIMIMPADNANPYVIDITPENNSDVSPTNLQVVYTFSEPIKQTAYTRTDLPKGHSTIIDDIIINYGGLKKTAGTISYSVNWNSTFSQLTITPQGVIGSAHYTADLRTVFNSGNITDLAGNKLTNNTAIVGDFEILNFTTSGGSVVPAAPSLKRVYISGQYTSLDYNGGLVELEWNYDYNARSYNIYKSINNGSFELLQKDFYGVQFTDNIVSLVVPSGAANPLTYESVRYTVCAESRDLVESAQSNIITVTDAVWPQLLTVSSVAEPVGPLYWWKYSLLFSEPLNVSNAETVTNYTILNPDVVNFAITKADYLGYNASSGHYLVQLIISTDLAVPAGYSIRVESGVTDLAGNSIDAASNIFTFSAPPTPVLSSPNTGATNIGLPVTLSWQPSNGATAYRLQISSNAGFTGIVFDSDIDLPNPITSTIYAVSSPLVVSNTYYWHVSASNRGGNSVYSAFRSFQP